VQLLAQVGQQFLAAAEGAGQAAAHPQARLAQRALLVAEEAVEAHRVVDLGGAEVQQVGDVLDGLQRHAAEAVLHHVQRRQRRRLLVRVARQVAVADRAEHLALDVGPRAHRSSSAAMMFRLPSTATTSLSWRPTIRYGDMAKWM